MKRILLVEDNNAIRHSVSIALPPEEFEVESAADAESGRQLFFSKKYDLILLDVMLPDGNGFELCADFRLKEPHLPIILITAKIDEASAVQGFSTGATDYIRKPFGSRELVARVKNCLQQKMSAKKVIRFENIEMDLDNRKVKCDRDTIELNRKAFDVLALLVQRGGDAVTREQILRLIDPDGETFDRSLDAHISHLRSKLKKSGAHKIEITTIYGIGYRLSKTE